MIEVGDDLLGEYQISLKQRLGGTFHPDADHAARIRDIGGERGKLVLVSGPHGHQPTVGPASGRRPRVNGW